MSSAAKEISVSPATKCSSKFKSTETSKYSGSCHCGAVRFEVNASHKKIKLWDCNCSDCSMRRNIHFIVPAKDFKLLKGEESQTLYLWGTKTAKRYFCRICGVLPYYIPRSNPDGVAITAACVEWDSADLKPEFEIIPYDGVNWEKSHVETGIAAESK